MSAPGTKFPAIERQTGIKNSKTATANFEECKRIPNRRLNPADHRSEYAVVSSQSRLLFFAAYANELCQIK